MKQVLIEGYTVDELLSMPDVQIAAFVGEPLVFKAGSAEILGSFRIKHESVFHKRNQP